MKQPCVYIMASSPRGTLYIGVTANLGRRAFEHRTEQTEGFTSKYGVHRLVWFEAHADMPAAIQRGKQIKKWNRLWKIRMIEDANPQWRDLYEDLA